MLAEHWEPNSGCELSKTVGWVVHFSSGDRGSESPLLVQIVMSMACRLLFFAGENAVSVVVTMLKNSNL